MSARREARRRDIGAITGSAGGVPASLLLGPCVEVWSDPKAKQDPYAQTVPCPGALSARRRHNDARRSWLDLAGITDVAEGCRVIPSTGAPWSTEYLSYQGQSDRVGRPVAEIVAERFARAGCTPADIPELRAEADNLARDTKRPSITPSPQRN